MGFLLQGPGITIGFATSRVRNTSTSEMQFTFFSDVLLSGMIISTNKTNYLQAFRLELQMNNTDVLRLSMIQ
jgi:hypothetical protein